jgi:hypothetical protein
MPSFRTSQTRCARLLILKNNFAFDVPAVLLDQGEDNESHQPGKGGRSRLPGGYGNSPVFQQSIPRIFLECLEASARSKQVFDQESMDWDVNGLCAIRLFPSET